MGARLGCGQATGCAQHIPRMPKTPTWAAFPQGQSQRWGPGDSFLQQP